MPPNHDIDPKQLKQQTLHLHWSPTCCWQNSYAYSLSYFMILTSTNVRVISKSYGLRCVVPAFARALVHCLFLARIRTLHWCACPIRAHPRPHNVCWHDYRWWQSSQAVLSLSSAIWRAITWPAAVMKHWVGSTRLPLPTRRSERMVCPCCTKLWSWTTPLCWLTACWYGLMFLICSCLI